MSPNVEQHGHPPPATKHVGRIVRISDARPRRERATCAHDSGNVGRPQTFLVPCLLLSPPVEEMYRASSELVTHLLAMEAQPCVLQASQSVMIALQWRAVLTPHL